MSERGVFAMDRGWFDHPTFAAEHYTQREAWAWLIAEAAYRPHKRRIGSSIVALERGQLAASLRFLAEKWQWHRSKVDRFLKRLAVHGMIETGTVPGQSPNLITICNYAKYQRVSLPKETEIGTVSGQYRDKVEYKEDQEVEISSSDTRRDPKKSKPLIPPEAFALSDEITALVGHDPRHPPPQWAGAAMFVSKWLREGWTREVILIAVRRSVGKKRGDPILSIKFFEHEIAREVARQSAPLPVAKIPQQQTVDAGGANGYQHRNGSGGSSATSRGGQRDLATLAIDSARAASAARRERSSGSD